MAIALERHLQSVQLVPSPETWEVKPQGDEIFFSIVQGELGIEEYTGHVATPCERACKIQAKRMAERIGVELTPAKIEKYTRFRLSPSPYIRGTDEQLFGQVCGIEIPTGIQQTITVKTELVQGELFTCKPSLPDSHLST